MDAGLMTPSYRTRHTFGLFSACIFRCACPFSPIHGYPIPFVPAIDTPSYRTERARRDRSLGLFSSDAEPMGDAGMAESGAETNVLHDLSIEFAHNLLVHSPRLANPMLTMERITPGGVHLARGSPNQHERSGTRRQRAGRRPSTNVPRG